MRADDHVRRRRVPPPRAPLPAGDGVEWVEPKVARRYREQPPLDLGEGAW